MPIVAIVGIQSVVNFTHLFKIGEQYENDTARQKYDIMRNATKIIAYEEVTLVTALKLVCNWSYICPTGEPHITVTKKNDKIFFNCIEVELCPFRIGDKVKTTKKYLSTIPNVSCTTLIVEGLILNVGEPKVRFTDGGCSATYNIKNLELVDDHCRFKIGDRVEVIPQYSNGYIIMGGDVTLTSDKIYFKNKDGAIWKYDESLLRHSTNTHISDDILCYVVRIGTNDRYLNSTGVPLIIDGRRIKVECELVSGMAGQRHEAIQIYDYELLFGG